MRATPPGNQRNGSNSTQPSLPSTNTSTTLRPVIRPTRACPASWKAIRLVILLPLGCLFPLPPPGHGVHFSWAARRTIALAYFIPTGRGVASSGDPDQPAPRYGGTEAAAIRLRRWRRFGAASSSLALTGDAHVHPHPSNLP